MFARFCLVPPSTRRPLASIRLPLVRHAALAALLLAGTTGCSSPSRAGFATPEDAVSALIASGDDPDRADELLGPGGYELLADDDEGSGVPDLDVVRELAEERLVLVDDDGSSRKVALLGEEEWPLPFPLVREHGQWRFDAEAGRENLRCRRIGANELRTIETLRALVDAQREFAATHLSGERDAPPVYAARIVSEPGLRDGLYWDAAADEPESPIGPLLAAAARDDSALAGSAARDDASSAGVAPADGDAAPFHGYWYRVLTEQGPNACGGARSYRDAEGRLTCGFAVLAWPATYGDSGVMTFVIDRAGVPYEKDLGDDTGKEVAQLTTFDPDGSWSLVAE